MDFGCLIRKLMQNIRFPLFVMSNKLQTKQIVLDARSSNMLIFMH